MTNSGINAGIHNAKVLSKFTNASSPTPKTPELTLSTPASPVEVFQEGTSKFTPQLNAQTGGKRKGKGKGAKKGKKGGALMDDVKNLAVPFAILLAKQGLQTMFDKKKTKSGSSELSAKSAASPTSARRKSTLTGGSCGSQCAAAVTTASHTGGAKAKSASSKRAASTRASGKASSSRASSSRGGSKGEQVKSRFEKLSKEIDEFLQKY
jgi:hypothetical protein